MSKQHVYILLTFVVFSWGLNVTATKMLAEFFMPVTMTAFRIFTAGVSVFIILFFMKKIRKLTKQESLYVILGSLLNVVLHHYFLSIGLTKTSAANGGLILGLAPLITTILTIIFLGNRISMIRASGIALGFTGVSFIVFQSGEGLSGVSIGDMYIFLSTLSQCFSFVVIKKLSNTLDPRLLTGYMLVIGAFILFMISLVTEPNGLESMAQSSPKMWMIFFASAIIATALGQMLYNYGIGQVGASEASIFTNLTPFFSIIGASLFLGESIKVNHIIGLLLIIIGVLFASGVIEELRKKQKLPHQKAS